MLLLLLLPLCLSKTFNAGPRQYPTRNISYILYASCVHISYQRLVIFQSIIGRRADEWISAFLAAAI